MEIKIAFSGIGGVGGYYGGKLAHFYRQSENIKIYFISRGENLEVISREGLKIQTLHEEIIDPGDSFSEGHRPGRLSVLYHQKL